MTKSLEFTTKSVFSIFYQLNYIQHIYHARTIMIYLTYISMIYTYMNKLANQLINQQHTD